MAQAGVDPTLEGRALQDALRGPIAIRRSSCSVDVAHASVVVRHASRQTVVVGAHAEQVNHAIAS